MWNTYYTYIVILLDTFVFRAIHTSWVRDGRCRCAGGELSAVMHVKASVYRVTSPYLFLHHITSLARHGCILVTLFSSRITSSLFIPGILFSSVGVGEEGREGREGGRGEGGTRIFI